jgi:hypothetical protein
MENQPLIVKLVKRTSLFICLSLLFITIMIMVSNAFISDRKQLNNETRANLPIIPQNTKFNHCILGISHGRSLSDGPHHQLFESKFGKTINLSVGNSLSGLKNQRLYLEYFFSKNNLADTMMIILSPTLLFNDAIDESSIAFYKEPIELDFIKAIYHHNTKNKYQQIFHYLKSKLSHVWMNPIYMNNEPETGKLDSINWKEVASGFKLAYPKNSKFDNKICRQDLTQLIELGKNKGMKIIIIIPPALFGKWPGHQIVMDYLKATSPTLQLFDASETILEPKYYRDHHHLNTDGIKQFLDLLRNKIHNREK